MMDMTMSTTVIKMITARRISIDQDWDLDLNLADSPLFMPLLRVYHLNSFLQSASKRNTDGGPKMTSRKKARGKKKETIKKKGKKKQITSSSLKKILALLPRSILRPDCTASLASQASRRLQEQAPRLQEATSQGSSTNNWQERLRRARSSSSLRISYSIHRNIPWSSPVWLFMFV